MHAASWVIQVILGVYFVVVGVIHFIVPDGLPGPAEWMYDLPDWLHYVTGTVEVLGGLGLLLPALTGIRRELMPLAAFGLAMVMVFAAAWHVPRGELQNIVSNLVVAGLLVFVGYARWREHPLVLR